LPFIENLDNFGGSSRPVNSSVRRNKRPLEVQTLMNLPNAPTDNLYKFLALTGLALFVLSIIFPLSQFRDVIRRSTELDGERSLIDVQLDYIESDVAQLSKRRDLSEDELRVLEKDFASDCEQQNPSPNKRKLSCAEAQQLKDKVREVRVLNKRAETNAALLDNLKNEAIFLALVSTVGMIGSIILAVKGFRLWHYRLQRYQDKIIAKEAADKESLPTSSA
jgi:septal ring factor EnvC (AmiA/AmiB activator)